MIRRCSPNSTQSLWNVHSHSSRLAWANTYSSVFETHTVSEIFVNALVYLYKLLTPHLVAIPLLCEKQSVNWISSIHLLWRTHKKGRKIVSIHRLSISGRLKGCSHTHTCSSAESKTWPQINTSAQPATVNKNKMESDKIACGVVQCTLCGISHSHRVV